MDFYHGALLGKTFVLKRGLRPDETQDGEIAVMIAKCGWFDLAVEPGVAVINVVKEFYANAHDSDNNVVQVRGRSVSFSPNAINTYYNFPTLRDDSHYLSH